jgi:DNA-binding phage protein
VLEAHLRYFFMQRQKTSKHQTYLKRLAKIDLDKLKGLRRADPLKELTDPYQTAMALFECLQNNDPDGAMEMIEIYLEALNKAKLRKRTNLPKSTMYSALKHRNPTIKTLAKIMYASTHESSKTQSQARQ